MGAPKQKWTSEEESALKAGVVKHGPGKWRTILKDPEFSTVLSLRSNVDLKDKWRNMHVMANSFGSREKSRVALKRFPHDENALAIVPVPNDDEFLDDQNVSVVPAVTSSHMQGLGSRRSTIRIDNLILEAIRNLNEPGGSHKTSIATYIEEQYWPPHDFKKILSAKLKHLTSRGKLIKVKRRYRISPPFPEKRRNPSIIHGGRPLFSPNIDRVDLSILAKSQIDMELARMRTMTPEEAALEAARAVAEAEVAIAEAEEAAREAEAAEADAEAAQAFADAAIKAQKSKTTSK